MKNNLLVEIQHMKKLMGLNETSNQECEAQLEKAGYVVYNRTEIKDTNLKCQSNPIIKCVSEWLDNNGYNNNYKVKKWKSYCYVVVQSAADITHNKDGKSKTINAKTYTFWDNGDVTYIRTYPDLQKKDEDTFYSQGQWKGKFKCVDKNEIQITGLRYEGMYKFNDLSVLIKEPKEFEITKPNGTTEEVWRLVKTNFEFKPTEIE